MKLMYRKKGLNAKFELNQGLRHGGNNICNKFS